MRHPHPSPGTARPRMPAGLATAKGVMLLQGLFGLTIGGLHTYAGLVSHFVHDMRMTGLLAHGVLVTALGGAVFVLAVRLRPGRVGPWVGSLLLQGGFGTVVLLTAVLFSLLFHDHLLIASFGLGGVAICWGTFALLLLPSSRPSRAPRPGSFG